MPITSVHFQTFTLNGKSNRFIFFIASRNVSQFTVFSLIEAAYPMQAGGSQWFVLIEPGLQYKPGHQYKSGEYNFTFQVRGSCARFWTRTFYNSLAHTTILMSLLGLSDACYGRPLSVSGRPCYILPMFFLFIFLWPPYSPALVNGGSRKFYTW